LAGGYGELHRLIICITAGQILAAGLDAVSNNVPQRLKPLYSGPV